MHTQVNPLGSLLILWSDNLLDHISFMVWQIWYLAWTMTDDRLASGVCVCMHVCTCIYLCTYHMHVPYGMYVCTVYVVATWRCDFYLVVWWFQHQSPNFMLYTNNSHVLQIIGGRKGGAVGLQAHLILRVLHRILIFNIEMKYFLVSQLAPTDLTVFLCPCYKY